MEAYIVSDFKKRGTVKVTNGKYTNDAGEEKNRYVTVGDYFSTDGGNRQAVKLYATAFSEEKWLNIYIEEKKSDKELTHDFNKQTRNVVPENIDDKPIDLSEIPF